MVEYKQVEELTTGELKGFSKKDFKSLLESSFNLPGYCNLKNTNLLIRAGNFFQKNKTYFTGVHYSKDYFDFWDREKRRILNGVTINGKYYSGYQYGYCNYCPIMDKVKGHMNFPEVWDVDYSFFLYIELCIVNGEFSATIKRRQAGFSYKHLAILVLDLWFIKDWKGKIFAQEEVYIEDVWNDMAVKYRDHLNTFTAWTRPFHKDEHLNWIQGIEVNDGKKKTIKGLKSSLSGRTTKQSATKGVGGFNNKVYGEEAGVNSTLLKTTDYIKDSLKQGSVMTGLLMVSGAAGEMKDSQGLKEIATNPESRNFRPVDYSITPYNIEKPICFFAPDFVNYIHEDPDTKIITKCYDEDGNSDLEKAIGLQREIRKRVLEKEGLQSYFTYCSQHPHTLEEVFQDNVESPFPDHLIKLQKKNLLLKRYKENTVELYYDANMEVKHRFINKTTVKVLKPNLQTDNTSAIVIDEMPLEPKPFGLYYAGIDPIKNVTRPDTTSLFSITIFKSAAYIDGKLSNDYPVAWYCGRHDDPYTTFETAMKLIRFYNAKCAIENNVDNFLQWMIKNKDSKYIMKRGEIYTTSDVLKRANTEELGVRMTAPVKSKIMEQVIDFCKEVVSTEYDMETGESKKKYGVEYINDEMLLTEMENYSPSLNTDRLISFGLSLIAARTNTNRQSFADLSERKKPNNVKPEVSFKRDLRSLLSKHYNYSTKVI